MELLQQIETYLDRAKISPSKFGRLALGDPRFVEDMRSGRRLRHETRERVRCYLTQAESGVT
jgi:hypothetical protein